MGSIFPDWLSLKTIPALTFLFFWGLNVLVIYLGIESIRKLLIFKAFILPILSILIFVWAVVVGGGFGPILAQPSQFKTDQQFWLFFLPGILQMIEKFFFSNSSYPSLKSTNWNCWKLGYTFIKCF